jgi:hypothetical protein
MPQFISPFDVNEDNRHLHIDNINTSNTLAYWFNQNIMKEPSSFGYNPHSKRVELYTKFDSYPENSKVIAQQINWILSFEEQFGTNDKDLFLVLYLKNFENITLKETEKSILKLIFTDLCLEDYFGKISAKFLRDKINSLLID